MEGKEIETIEMGQRREVESACMRLSALPDTDFVMGEQVTGNPENFDRDTSWAAWGWRLAGQEGEEENRTVEDLLAKRPRLRFFVAYKALSDAFETESEMKEQGQVLKPATREWRSKLVDVLNNGIEELARLPENEKIGRLELIKNLVSRSLMNISQIPIDRLDKDGASYASEAVGESYLTLEEVDRIGEALYKYSDATEETREGPEAELWWDIDRYYSYLENRRELLKDEWWWFESSFYIDKIEDYTKRLEMRSAVWDQYDLEVMAGIIRLTDVEGELPKGVDKTLADNFLREFNEYMAERENHSFGFEVADSLLQTAHDYGTEWKINDLTEERKKWCVEQIMGRLNEIQDFESEDGRDVLRDIDSIITRSNPERTMSGEPETYLSEEDLEPIFNFFEESPEIKKNMEDNKERRMQEMIDSFNKQKNPLPTMGIP